MTRSCALYAYARSPSLVVYTVLIRIGSDNIYESKIYTMSLTKQITLTKQQFNNLNNVYFDYLQNNPNDIESLKTIQSIINQSID